MAKQIKKKYVALAAAIVVAVLAYFDINSDAGVLTGIVCQVVECVAEVAE